MSNIGLMAGVGAPTSLAIDLAKRFDMTLLGFVKKIVLIYIQIKKEFYFKIRCQKILVNYLEE